MITFNRKENGKPERCAECKFNFTPRSHRFFCCDANILVCESCHFKNQCKKCGKLRTHKAIKCIICRSPKNEQDAFYDFKAECHYCPKCIAKNYIHGYELMARQNGEPSKCMVRLADKSQYCIIDLIHFYERWCFCCLKQFNKNAYQMKFGARICESCLQANFDIALPKLIMCVECNGYIRDLSEIKFQITPTQVLCIYCSVDELKTYDAHKKKSEVQACKQSRIICKSSLKNNGIIVPASQMSKIKQQGNDLPAVMRSNLIKVISRSSIQEESLNFMVSVIKPSCQIICIICHSLNDESSVFQFTEQDAEKLNLLKMYHTNKSNKICRMCFNQISHLIKNKPTGQKIFQQLNCFNSNKELSTTLQLPPTNIPSFQSAKTFPLSPRSPRAKIFEDQPNVEKANLCQNCKLQYATIKMDNKLICRACFTNVKK